ncbi:MAG: tetratricopeptide repeat protein, partial [Magnetococcales bacterium]|nr:tetratricopeptide repeat protein [Magnetococcales bacterium]
MPLTPKTASEPTTVKERYEQALLAYRQGDNERAEQLCWEILMIQSQHADTLNMMAVIARTSGRGAAGVELAGRAVKVKPHFFAYHFNLGLAYLDVGKPEKAIAALQEAVRLNPHFVDSLAALGSALRKLGRLPEALQAFEKACSIQPKSVENCNMCGVVLHEMNRLEEAILWYRKAITLKKTF